MTHSRRLGILRFDNHHLGKCRIRLTGSRDAGGTTGDGMGLVSKWGHRGGTELEAAWAEE